MLVSKRTRESCKHFVSLYTTQTPPNKLFPRSWWDKWRHWQLRWKCHYVIVAIIEDCDPKKRVGVFDRLFDVSTTPKLIELVYRALTVEPDGLLGWCAKNEVRGDILEVMRRSLPLKNLPLPDSTPFKSVHA
jgi:hypothetical protein